MLCANRNHQDAYQSFDIQFLRSIATQLNTEKIEIYREESMGHPPFLFLFCFAFLEGYIW